MQIMNYENIKLIIFDCDGVLIDSETISTNVIEKQFLKLNIDLDIKYIRKNFIGRSYMTIKKHISKNFNVTLPNNFEEEYRSELIVAFEKQLKAIPGVKNILQTLNIKKCVATSSSLLRAKKSLSIVDLIDLFDDNIYSAYNMGEKGKPAPDIYLNCAKVFDIQPKDTLVIEDSLLGLQGAKRAGMKVWHYIGASHLSTWNKNHKYEYQPDLVFDNMHDFFKYLPNLKKRI